MWQTKAMAGGHANDSGQSQTMLQSDREATVRLSKAQLQHGTSHKQASITDTLGELTHSYSSQQNVWNNLSGSDFAWCKYFNYYYNVYYYYLNSVHSVRRTGIRCDTHSAEGIQSCGPCTGYRRCSRPRWGALSHSHGNKDYIDLLLPVIVIICHSCL